jgi:hypothetical protein
MDARQLQRLIDHEAAKPRPPTLQEAQRLMAERERAAQPTPADPFSEALAVQNAAIRLARDLGAQAGIVTGRILERHGR